MSRRRTELDLNGTPVPVPACRSTGGPFDDRAFVGGYMAGRLALRMIELRTPRITVTVLAEIVPTIDLIAMGAGYTMRILPITVEAGYVRISLAANDPNGDAVVDGDTTIDIFGAAP